MSGLVLHLALTVAWLILAGGGAASLAVGMVAAWLVLAWTRPTPGVDAYVRRLPRALGLAGFFLAELVLSSVEVTREVLTPRRHRRPGIIALPLDVETDLEIALLACLVTLTPGTLALDVSADRRTLWIHAMFVTDADALRSKIKSGFERRILELLR